VLERIFERRKNMTPRFNEWWDSDKLMDENPYTAGTPIWWAWEGWAAGAKDEREACARLAATEAILQHDADTARNPSAAVMHSPDAAKWLKMAAMIRMRSNGLMSRPAMKD
jgi:hypothetical protein